MVPGFQARFPTQVSSCSTAQLEPALADTVHQEDDAIARDVDGTQQPQAPERLSLYILPLAYDVLNAYGTKVQVNVWMELPGREGQAIKARATGDEAHGQSNLKEESVRLRGT